MSHVLVASQSSAALSTRLKGVVALWTHATEVVLGRERALERLLKFDMDSRNKARKAFHAVLTNASAVAVARARDRLAARQPKTSVKRAKVLAAQGVRWYCSAMLLVVHRGVCPWVRFHVPCLAAERPPRQFAGQLEARQADGTAKGVCKLQSKSQLCRRRGCVCVCWGGVFDVTVAPAPASSTWTWLSRPLNQKLQRLPPWCMG